MYDDPRNSDLEEAIARDPQDREPYLVLADWLEGCGDARAALIRAQAAESGTHGYSKGVRKLLADHRDYFIGALGKAGTMIHWSNGYVSSITLTARAKPAHVARVLAHPSARFVRFLTVASPELAPRLEVIARDAPSTLRDLRCQHEGPGDASLAPLATLLPRLVVLGLTGRFALGAEALRPASGLGTLQLYNPMRGPEVPVELALPKLTSLTMRGPFAPSRVEVPELVHADLALPRADFIAEVHCPKLLTLKVCFTDGGRPRQLAELFARDLPLGRFELHAAPVGDDVLELLFASPFAARLETLVLNDVGLTDAGATLLAARRDAFPALEHLDVRANAFSDAGFATLEGMNLEILDRDRYDGAYE